MLFTSYVFLFAFLPVALAGFFLAAQLGGRTAGALWLIAASFAFYGWWNPASVPLLAASVAGNYAAGRLLLALGGRPHAQAWVLALAIAANLGLLIWFKYLAWLLGLGGAPDWMVRPIAGMGLPLGISFFTFTQIAVPGGLPAGMAKHAACWTTCCSSPSSRI